MPKSRMSAETSTAVTEELGSRAWLGPSPSTDASLAATNGGERLTAGLECSTISD